MSSFTTRAHDTAKIRAHKRHLDGNSAPTSAQTFAAATYQAGFEDGADYGHTDALQPATEDEINAAADILESLDGLDLNDTARAIITTILDTRRNQQ